MSELVTPETTETPEDIEQVYWRILDYAGAQFFRVAEFLAQLDALRQDVAEAERLGRAIKEVELHEHHEKSL